MANKRDPSAGAVLEPAVRSPANKGRRFPAELLRSEEIRALIRACSSRAPTGVRNRALIAVLYRGGLRISEALALLPKDVDSAQGTLTVLHGKGDGRRSAWTRRPSPCSSAGWTAGANSDSRGGGRSSAPSPASRSTPPTSAVPQDPPGGVSR